MACCAGIEFNNLFTEWPGLSSSVASKAADYDVQAASDSRMPRPPSGNMLGTQSINGSTKDKVMANEVDVFAEPSKAALCDVETGSVSIVLEDAI